MLTALNINCPTLLAQTTLAVSKTSWILEHANGSDRTARSECISDIKLRNIIG